MNECTIGGVSRQGPRLCWFKTLHEDKAVPGYSLSESYENTPAGKSAVIVVLVQRFSQGFEGRDRRFIAVTGQPR
ncbi:MAG: hypothetical protein E5W65_25090 [Mesorhizobium sp.]|uniref:hypothetical protein n=1 Tax=Mesorhizobium sp. TaxID=1871066 RepID=UPI0011FAAA70|nr:hypothetical protein [Mesorhizobium sp.]TIT32464.1 MAG: hypothetical protein E5W65_25090 [Mesorhizobium sp.]TIT69526.1 MAG: hypothetical protein E5W63_04530 [Mesorhizobium sp.]